MTDLLTLGENTLDENERRRLETLKPRVPKQTTTVRFGWTRGKICGLREKTLRMKARGEELKLPKSGFLK
jgi:hypothetical protein